MEISELINQLLNDTKKQKEFFSNKLAFMISPFELVKLIHDDIKDFNIVDVRLYEEYIEGHIPFAIHIPVDNFEQHLNMLEKDKINIIYCQSDYCIKALKAATISSSHGFKTRILIDGYKGWSKLRYDTVKVSQ